MTYCGIKPQFIGVIEAASNIGREPGDYTVEQFKADYPQFFGCDGSPWVPESMLEVFIAQANSAIQKDKWFDYWRIAVGLYAAHHATMYLRAGSGTPSPTAAAAALSGEVVGTIKSASLGDASATYDDSGATAGTGDWGILNATSYGQQLASMAKLIGIGGSYVL